MMRKEWEEAMHRAEDEAASTTDWLMIAQQYAVMDYHD